MWFCSLSSGSSGNCIYVGTERTNILIDAGLSGKSIENLLNEAGVSPKEIDAILVTHEHDDHIKGIGVLHRRFNIPVYANNNTWGAMKNKLGAISEDCIKVIDTGGAFEIGDIEIVSYKTPHDAAESVGYSFYNGRKKISIATDIGHVNEDIIRNVKDSDLLLLESNHDVSMLKFGPYPYVLKRRILSDIGHLSNDDAGFALLKILGDKYMTVVLGHLSQKNNYPELAYKTVESTLTENGINIERDLRLYMAKRDGISKFFEI